MTCTGCATTGDRAVLLPAEVAGWRADGPGDVYTAETLYDYIDGSAEVYLALNVREVTARRYVSETAPDILADVFDMGTSEDAYGAYHHDMREGEGVGIGQESEYHGGSLAFWKGRYFVSIVPLGTGDAVAEGVLALGRFVGQAIRAEGRRPEIVGLLPEDRLLKAGLHFFHDHLSLNSHFFLAEDNLLLLGKHTDGVVTRYQCAQPGADPFVVLLVSYPEEAMAEDARGAFIADYLPEADESGAGMTENGLWTAVCREGALLMAAFDAPSSDEIGMVFDEVERRCRSGRPGRRVAR